MPDNNIPIAEEALTPAELIKKHNSDPTHQITNDEMKNLKIGDRADNKEEFDKAVDDKLAEDDLGQQHENNSYDILDV